MSSWILKPIRHIYVSLHQDTDSAPTQFSTSTDWDPILAEPSSYPVCKVAGHIHDNSAPTTFAPTILHDNAALVPSIASPAASPLSVSSSLRSIESLASVLPLDNFHPVRQKTVESLRTSATSPDAAIAGTIRDIITSGTSISQSTLEHSISSPPLSPTSPPAAVSLRQNTEPLMPSVPPNLPSRASSSVLSTESRHPIVATAAPSASPRLTSAPGLGAAADDDGSRKPGLRKDKDAVDPPSVNRAIHGHTMSTPYPPPESPSQPSVTDSDLIITGRSPRGPLAIPERTGDHFPHPSQPDHRFFWVSQPKKPEKTPKTRHTSILGDPSPFLRKPGIATSVGK
ncbi:hypothetical protein EDB84DRAFT_1680191 [Lactarius hengduanensis]|nr:hypothetical protein EDB84DRAFT_1680191 [Lactarius hengduanensis]